MKRVPTLWRSAGKSLGAAAAVVVTLVAWAPPPAMAQNCSSMNPTDWPLPAKPYFMIAFDTSGSMSADVGSPSSCGYGNQRRDHGRCAIYNIVTAYGGLVSFGLSHFATYLRFCNAGACYSGCDAQQFANDDGPNWGCGNEDDPSPWPNNNNSEARRGANIIVPLARDDFWNSPPESSNVTELLEWVDDDCTNSKEVSFNGWTPLNGILRDMYRYFYSGWTHPDGAPTYPSPLGTLAEGERPCRSINVILITDGGESCDSSTDAYDAARDLYNGFTKDGITWHIKVHVIDFGGGGGATADNIADAGDDGDWSNNSASAHFAGNEVELSQALADIIFSAIEPEVCDNTDNNCNGCVDEGYVHYCNTGQICCAWTNQSERSACLTAYESSIATNPPDGDLTLLPCTTVAQQQQPSTWLCYNPHEVCDGADNNCDGTVDEEVLTCGNPAHCPTAEVCNGEDDNCDGFIDEGGVCGSCVPSTEVCNGCDDDCDGVIDNGTFPDVACGLPTPANCDGVMSCLPPISGVSPGTCQAGRGYGACSNSPQPEVCDCEDNDCNGVVDDGLSSSSCVPPGHPAGLDYGPDSQCEMGFTVCTGCQEECHGGVDPSAEVCDNVDNDCNGVVDDNVSGVGLPCGTNNPPCTAGTTVCQNGQIVCQGGSSGDPEICNGLDDDCDTIVDDAPLDDAPGPGETGCWDEPGTCCSHQGYTWCPPPGATCHDASDLEPPCAAGTLVCDGANGWTCQGARPPETELCDGLDNDCNGQIDDFADCPPQGGVDFYCIEGSCKSECNPADEFPCPAGFGCEEIEHEGQLLHICMPGTGECGGTTCPNGWVCIGEECVDPCDPNPCSWWEECWMGACSDNTCTGDGQQCFEGQYCVNHECVDDPCPDAGCDPRNEACVRDCDATSCTATCEPVCTCPQGQYCDEAGDCVPDLCYEVGCGLGERCDPQTGQCTPDDCAQAFCDQFQVCHDGACLDDPCLVVSCPQFFECVVRESEDGSDLRTLCEPEDGFWVPGDDGGSVTVGGGGCACQAGAGPEGPGLGLLLLLGLLWRRRRRCGRRGGRP